MANQFNHPSLTRTLQALKAEGEEFKVFATDNIDHNRPTSALGNYEITTLYQKARSRLDGIWILFKEHDMKSNFTGPEKTMTSQEITLCSEEPCFKKSAFDESLPATLESGLTCVRIKVDFDKNNKVIGVDVVLLHNRFKDYELTIFCLEMIRLFSEDAQKAIMKASVS